MHRFEKCVSDTIRMFHMIEKGDHVVAGVSGGADSVCLLLCLLALREQIGFSLQAVHVEHGIRGEESLADAFFVEALCAEKGVPCEVVHGDIPALARARRISAEEAARDFRYGVFREVSGKRSEKRSEKCRIAVAHHLEDQAETVLHNLARGTGLSGLGGMRPVQEDIIRPLMGRTREEIEEYLTDAGQTWRTDRTNLDTVYTRNRIRHLVMPELARMNARAEAHICEAAELAAKADAYLAGEAKSWCADRIHRKGPGNGKARQEKGQQEKQWQEGNLTLTLDDFSSKPEILREYILREALRTCGPMRDIGAVHIRSLLDLAKMPCGKCTDLPGNRRVCREENALYFQQTVAPEEEIPEDRTNGADCPERIFLTKEALPADGDPYMVSFGDLTVVFRVMSRSAFDARGIDFTEENKYTKWLAYDTINKVLCLRKREPGDYICVNRDGGRKKWNRYMIDRKIPARDRERIPLIADGNRILWAVGYRMAADAGIREDTTMIVEIRIENKAGQNDKGTE